MILFFSSLPSLFFLLYECVTFHAFFIQELLIGIMIFLLFVLSIYLFFVNSSVHLFMYYIPTYPFLYPVTYLSITYSPQLCTYLPTYHLSINLSVIYSPQLHTYLPHYLSIYSSIISIHLSRGVNQGVFESPHFSFGVV